MRFLIYLIGSLILMSCTNTSSIIHSKESVVVEEIIYQRAKTLIVIDKMMKEMKSEKANLIGDKIKIFYSDTHPHVNLGDKEEINMMMVTYEDISEDVELSIEQSKSYSGRLIDKLWENLEEQKNFYMHVLEDRELHSLHYYALDSYLQVLGFMDDIKYMLNKNIAVK